MKNSILVTGAHRSGTTWTGRVIAKAKNVRYVQEPFNVQQAGRNSPLKYWYEYMPGTSEPHQEAIRNYLLSYFKKDYTTTLDNLKQVDSLLGGYAYAKDLLLRNTTERTLIKDPIALMSAEWIYQLFTWQTVVLIRHPAAFTASLKIKGWKFNFNHLHLQPALIEQYFPEYADRIALFARESQHIVEQGILLWNITSEVVLQLKKKYLTEWYFARHEDLSRQPELEFSKMYQFLGLPFDNNVKRYLTKTTTTKEASEWKRDAIQNIKTWKYRLTPEEIERVKIGTQEVWQHFYTESDW
ncbi:MAG: sulfotransferase [Saprospiraceae bacterium]